jgi:hypothetical protein
VNEIVTKPVPSKVTPPETLLCSFCGGKGYEDDGHLSVSPDEMRYRPPSLCRMCKGEKEVFVCPASQGSDTAAARRLMVKAAEDYKAKCDELDRLREAAKPFANLLPACAGSADEWPLVDALDGYEGRLPEVNCGHVRRLNDMIPLPGCTECGGNGCDFCEGTGVDDK